MAQPGFKRPCLAFREPTPPADTSLARTLADALVLKRQLRTLMVRTPVQTVTTPHPPAGRVGGAAAPAPIAAVGAAPPTTVQEPLPVADGPDLQHARCRVSYDANRKITEVIGSVQVRRKLPELAPLIDPRSWGRSGGIIFKAFAVEERGREYVPRADLDDVELGDYRRLKMPLLLYEYARSDVASFENILAITSFNVAPENIRLEYELHDCLLTTFGFWTAPGGLTANEGYSQTVPIDGYPGWSRIEVLKRVKVRDLTPNDPGDPFDYGLWINATMGAALAQWVDNTRLMGPIL